MATNVFLSEGAVGFQVGFGGGWVGGVVGCWCTKAAGPVVRICIDDTCCRAQQSHVR